MVSHDRQVRHAFKHPGHADRVQRTRKHITEIDQQVGAKASFTLVFKKPLAHFTGR